MNRQCTGEICLVATNDNDLSSQGPTLNEVHRIEALRRGIVPAMPQHAAKKKRPGGLRANNAEVARRLLYVEEELANGTSRPLLIAACRSKFDIAPRTVDGYIAQVHAAWSQEQRAARPLRLAAARHRLQIAFEQLAKEMRALEDGGSLAQVKDQFIAKLRRKKRHLTDEALERFEAAAGCDPDELLDTLKQASPTEAANWFKGHVTVGALLDQRVAEAERVLISDHKDEIRRIEKGSRPPDDYLESFQRYVASHLNTIPAMLAVTQRPRSLSRAALKELKLALDAEGYSEVKLRAAWRHASNRDIAASILGYIRQAALGDPLLPYGDRVRAAVAKMEASRAWTPVQRKWLQRLGDQLIAETVVDKGALESGQFRQQGGFKRINKIFDGELEELLGELVDAIWESAG